MCSGMDKEICNDLMPNKYGVETRESEKTGLQFLKLWKDSHFVPIASDHSAVT